LDVGEPPTPGSHGSGRLCLDREHVDHLDLTRARRGDCVEVSWSGGLLVAQALTRVEAVTCAPS
ncbi:MAG: hypothetical protein ACRYF3_01710, partial [Janthinobacterium lividum]